MLSVRTMCVCRLCEFYLFGQCVFVGCVNVICSDNAYPKAV